MTAEMTAAAGVRFPVEGMTCTSCVNRIERYLRNVDTRGDRRRAAWWAS